MKGVAQILCGLAIGSANAQAEPRPRESRYGAAQLEAQSQYLLVHDKPRKAIQIFNAALAIERHLHDRHGEVDVLLSLGSLYNRVGDKPQAEHLLQAAQAEGDRRQKAAALDLLASVYGNVDCKQAMSFLDRAAAVRSTIADPLGRADAQRIRGEVYSLQGYQFKALRELRSALTVYSRRAGLWRQGLATLDIAKAYELLRDSAHARSSAHDAIAKFRKLGSQTGEAQGIQLLGEDAYNGESPDTAYDMYAWATRIQRRIGDKVGETSSLIDIGNLFYSQTDRAATSTLDRAVDLTIELGDRIGEAQARSTRAMCYAERDPEKAVRGAEQACEIANRTGSPETRAICLSNLGTAYGDLGQSEKSKDCFQDTLSIFLHTCDYQGYAISLNNIGRIMFFDRDPRGGLKLLNKALQIEVSRRLLRVESDTLSNIGYAYNSLSRLDLGTQYTLRALKLKRLVRDHDGEATCLVNLASFYGKTKLLGDSLRCSIRAIEVYRSTKNLAGEADALNNVAVLYRGLQHYAASIVNFKLAVNLYQDERALMSGLSRDDRLSFRQLFSDTYRGLANLLTAAGRFGERTEVLALLTEAEYSPATRPLSAELLTLSPAETTWSLSYESLCQTLARDGEALDDLEAKALAHRLTGSELTRRRGLITSVQNDQSRLIAFLDRGRDEFARSPAFSEGPRNHAFLEMLAKAPAATAAIITLADKDTVRTSLSLPDGTTTTTSSLARISSQTLVSKVEQLRDELRDPRSDPLPLLAFFYDLLIRPIEPKLRSERIGNLLVSLDGPLRFLPVSALFDRATKKFLFQIYACSNYFAGDIQTLGRQIIPHPTAVCFGATKPVRVGAEQIDPLTSTTEELDAFVQAFGGTRYVDERFTRPTFAQTLREPPTYLEIAAHFQTYPESAIDSFLNLGDGKQFVVHELDDFAPNALAPTDMVVLACCDSGAPARMETYPDEVESFAWKAKKLGARTVISTLWSVGDLSTGYLMARFYRELHQHPEAGKLEALRKAQCWLMSLRERDLGAGYTGDRRPFSHPYFWAPLVLTGNPY